MDMDCAPVALFAFRRPEHLSRCLESLRANKESSHTQLWVFCDGPRDDADRAQVEEVRRSARAEEGFAGVRIIEQPTNIGLASSVMTGVSKVLEESERVIVVEDDLVVSPDFLGFMNQGLELYSDDPEVVSIHGFVYQVDRPLPPTFFLRGADCWGWATWRRGWSTFNEDGRALLEEIDARGLQREFDFEGAYPYRKMLEDQVAGRIDSWAIRWYASAFLAGKLTLYPGQSLVENIGMDGSGTHSTHSESHSTRSQSFGLPLQRIACVEDVQTRSAIVAALRNSHSKSIVTRFNSKLRDTLSHLRY